MSNHRAHDWAPGVGLPQILVQERKDLLPAVHRLLLPVGRAVVIEEAVARAGVAMELEVLAVLLQLRLVLVDLLGRRRLGLRAQEPEERGREVLGEVDGRRRLVRGQLLLRHDHAAAPALDDRVEPLPLAAGAGRPEARWQPLQRAAGEERLPAPRARAEDADLAGEIRLRAQPGVGAVEVAEHPRVRGAARRPHLGPHLSRGAGVPWASRKYRFGEIATRPWWAKRRVHSRYHSSQPGAWWMTIMPGNGPAPSGRATYALMTSPLCPLMVPVSAIMPSY